MPATRAAETLMNKWVQAVQSHDPDAVTSLYDHEQGVLWGTFSDHIRNTPGDIRDYFVHFLAKPNLRAEVTDHVSRLVGDVLVDSGSYRFCWEEDGPQCVDARFSFMWVKHGDEWHIVDHHSSVVPH